MMWERGRGRSELVQRAVVLVGPDMIPGWIQGSVIVTEDEVLATSTRYKSCAAKIAGGERALIQQRSGNGPVVKGISLVQLVTTRGGRRLV